MSRRRCFLRCGRRFPLYALPKEDEVKDRWLVFIFSTVPDTSQYNPSLLLCSLHFTEDCFLNRAQFNAGFSRRLVLKDGAVPALLGQSGGDSGPQAASGGSVCPVLPTVRHVASQTDSPETRPETRPQTRTVGTQLSIKTLQNAFRSTATQVRVPSRDCGVCTLTFPLDSPILFLQPTVVKRPSKRPRLSLKEEEEGPSESSLSVVAHEPENST